MSRAARARIEAASAAWYPPDPAPVAPAPHAAQLKGKRYVRSLGEHNSGRGPSYGYVLMRPDGTHSAAERMNSLDHAKEIERVHPEAVAVKLQGRTWTLLDGKPIVDERAAQRRRELATVPPPPSVRPAAPATSSAWLIPTANLGTWLQGIDRAVSDPVEIETNVFSAHEQLSAAQFAQLNELDDRQLADALSIRPDALAHGIPVARAAIARHVALSSGVLPTEWGRNPSGPGARLTPPDARYVGRAHERASKESRQRVHTEGPTPREAFEAYGLRVYGPRELIGKWGTMPDYAQRWWRAVVDAKPQTDREAWDAFNRASGQQDRWEEIAPHAREAFGLVAALFAPPARRTTARTSIPAPATLPTAPAARVERTKGKANRKRSADPFGSKALARERAADDKAKAKAATWTIYPHAQWSSADQRVIVTGQGYVARPRVGAGVPYSRMEFDVFPVYKSERAATAYADKVNSGAVRVPGPFFVGSKPFALFQDARDEAYKRAYSADRVVVWKLDPATWTKSTVFEVTRAEAAAAEREKRKRKPLPEPVEDPATMAATLINLANTARVPTLTGYTDAFHRAQHHVQHTKHINARQIDALSLAPDRTLCEVFELKGSEAVDGARAALKQIARFYK